MKKTLLAALLTTCFAAPSMAQTGDVVLISVGRRDALAICNGTTALAPATGGLVAAPMAAAHMAWRVA